MTDTHMRILTKSIYFRVFLLIFRLNHPLSSSQRLALDRIQQLQLARVRSLLPLI